MITRLARSRNIFAIVLIAYLGVTIAVLWNLVSQINTAVPGGAETDFHQFLWGFWWIGYALQQGQSPLWSNYVLYPHVSNMALHTLAANWYPIFAVLEPLIGRVATLNVMVVLCFLFSGMAMFGWLRRLLGASGPATVVAFIGGLAFAFSPYLLVHSSWAQLNLTPIWWFPLILLLWDELAFPRRLPRWASAVLLGLACWGLWLTDLEYVVWAPIGVGGYVLWTLWATRRNGRWLPIVGWGVVAAAIMLGLAWFYPLAALLQVNLDPNEYPPAGLGTIRTFSVPLSALFGLAPNVPTRTLGHVLVWLVWMVVALWVIGRLTRRPALLGNTSTSATLGDDSIRGRPYPGRWLWLLLVLPPLIMALGPDTTIAGIDVPLPYLVLHTLLKGQHRVPSRFTGATFAMLITFLAVAWTPLLARLAARRRIVSGFAAGAISIALLADAGAFAPFPVRFMPDWDIYHQIAQDKRDFVIMDVPVGTQYGWTGIGKGYFFMYYGPVHQHRMINGWISRIPWSAFLFYRDSPLFSWLADASAPDEQGRAAAGEQLEKYLREWPIGYVILHRDWVPTEHQDDWIGWLNTRPGLCPAAISQDTNLIWWRSRSLGCDPAPITDRIALGTPADWTVIGNGWYQQEIIGGPAGRWAGQTASLRVTLQPDTAYELTFTALPFGENRTLKLGGAKWSSEEIRLTPGDWHTYKVTIPAGALAGSLLYLQHNGAASPAQLGLSTDNRSLAVAYGSFTFRPAA